MSWLPADGAWWTDDDDTPDHRKLQVDVEENPEIGVLYGPSGQLMRVVRAKATVPFGFQSLSPTR